MKLLSTLILILLFQYSTANTYYINPKGSDEAGNGTMANPWRTLFKATATVKEPGSIIHVMAGTYSETVRSTLAPGVSIEGDGPSSIIQSTLSEEFVAIIIAYSAEGTDGNQHISNIKLDGNKRTTSWAIEIRGRKNMSIHDCVITDFEDRGVVWTGREDNQEGEPKIYATGNSFYNNAVTNCAKYDSYGRGCLNIGGQEGMLIYNNIISQTGRPRGSNGWPIKYYNGGFLKGCKIYNNKITKEAYDGISWDFAIELFNESGLEIYNNTIVGSIDLNHQVKGTYPYSVYIHDNIIGPAASAVRMETGITMEYETESLIIENNQLKNLGTPVYFTPREGCVITNVIIKNNTCENIGVADGEHHGYAVNFISGGQSFFVTDFFVYNNKFMGSEKAAPYYGFGIAGATYAANIKIQGNTFKNFSVAAITANPAFIIDTLSIENNIFSGNGNGNNPFYTRGVPSNYTVKNNNKSNAASGYNFTQRLIRPLYYELKNSNVIEFIAMLAALLALLFCSKENVYFFPLFLISKFIFMFMGYDDELFGEVFLNLFYVALCVYGWKLWLKRDRKKHRIVRVTSSSKKDWIIALAIFALVFTVILLAFSYYKKAFIANSFLWWNAFALATAFTAVWLLVNKKVESWYWLLMASTVSFVLFYLNNYLITGFYHAALFLVAIWGQYKWRKRKMIKRRS